MMQNVSSPFTSVYFQFHLFLRLLLPPYLRLSFFVHLSRFFIYLFLQVLGSDSYLLTIAVGILTFNLCNICFYYGYILTFNSFLDAGNDKR